MSTTTTRIMTTTGSIAVEKREATIEPIHPPLVFLHGVFLDRTLWSKLPLQISDRDQIFIDMPVHGESTAVGDAWSLADCVNMLETILDQLGIGTCVAIGHSWGGMTILRSASDAPDRYAALGFFNTPFRRVTGLSRFGFQFQKWLLAFPNSYGRQAAKALYSTEFLNKHPNTTDEFSHRFEAHPRSEFARVIDAVLLQPKSTGELFSKLNVPCLAVVGESDYVGHPPSIETVTVPGGHVSPHEAPVECITAVSKILELA